MSFIVKRSDLKSKSADAAMTTQDNSLGWFMIANLFRG